MNTGSSPSSQELSPAIIAEAAAWLSLLSEPEPSEDAKAGFQRWLNEHADHKRAYEEVKEIWEQAGQVAIQPPARTAQRYTRSTQSVRAHWWNTRWLTAAAILVCIVLAVRQFYWDSRLWLETDVGQNRDFSLEDDTLAHLNTATRIEVHYTDTERAVWVERGEVFFNVAKEPGRPFVVRVGDKQIVALGTSFYVRRDLDRTMVTLAEGSIEVIAGHSRRRLKSGERLTFTPSSREVLDRPDMAYISAWRRGAILFREGTSLREAVAEMNRYRTQRLVIEDPGLEGRTIGGSYSVADQAVFTDALEFSFGIRHREEKGRVLLFDASRERRASP